MTANPFDFRRPPAGDMERRISAWLAEACRRTQTIWPKFMPGAVELRPGQVGSVSALSAFQGLSADAVGFRVSCSTSPSDPLLLAVPRPLLLALIASVLGESLSELPADRELGGVEASLCDLIGRELFCVPFERAWPLPDPVRFDVSERGSPRSLWRTPAAEIVLSATTVVHASFGEHPIQLLLPRSGVVEQLTRSNALPPPVSPADPKQIESIVREMPVDMSVILGSADLTLLDLARLRMGDVVILSQKVTEPLQAQVAGADKFRVWPGAVGSHHAVQIHSPAGS